MIIPSMAHHLNAKLPKRNTDKLISSYFHTFCMNSSCGHHFPGLKEYGSSSSCAFFFLNRKGCCSCERLLKKLYIFLLKKTIMIDSYCNLPVIIIWTDSSGKVLSRLHVCPSEISGITHMSK